MWWLQAERQDHGKEENRKIKLKLGLGLSQLTTEKLNQFKRGGLNVSGILVKAIG
jgi:hypothetical protein